MNLRLCDIELACATESVSARYSERALAPCHAGCRHVTRFCSSPHHVHTLGRIIWHVHRILLSWCHQTLNRWFNYPSTSYDTKVHHYPLELRYRLVHKIGFQIFKRCFQFFTLTWILQYHQQQLKTDFQKANTWVQFKINKLNLHDIKVQKQSPTKYKQYNRV